MKKRKTFVLTVIAAGAIMLIISWFAGRIISKNRDRKKSNGVSAGRL